MTDELTQLIAEQERDMTTGHRVKSVSLESIIEYVIPGDGVVARLATTGHRHLRVARVFARPVEADPISRERRVRHQYVELDSDFCRAYIDAGHGFAHLVRCSFRTAVGDFCLPHARRNGVLAFLAQEAEAVL